MVLRYFQPKNNIQNDKTTNLIEKEKPLMSLDATITNVLRAFDTPTSSNCIIGATTTFKFCQFS